MPKAAPFTALLVILLMQPAWANEPVSLRLKWFHSYQFAGYYAAKEKGFYAEAGLDVTIEQRDINTSPANDVLTGRNQFGVADSSLILRRLNKEPVVMLAVFFQSSPLVLMTLSDSGISSPLDLKGKRVMYQKDVDDAQIMAVFTEVGMTEADFTQVPHNFDNWALLNGDVDAMSAYISNQPYLYKERGIAVNIINPANYGIDFYGDNLFTSNKMVEQNPQLVLAFRGASIKGWQYALDNPDEVYDWLVNKYGAEYSSKDEFDYEVNTIRRMIKPRLVELGEMSPSRFRRLADLYKEKGLAPADSNIDGLHYLEYFTTDENDRVKYIIALSAGVIVLISLMFLLVSYQLKRIIKHKTQELMKANQVKTNFLQSMSHELRTPLNSIIGFSQRLMKTHEHFEDDRLIISLKTIHKSGELLLGMVNDLLDIEKIESGRMELKLAEYPLAGIIQQSVEQVTVMAEEKGLTFSLPNEYPISNIRVDQKRLTEVLLNLLSNAVKYSEKGTIRIFLACEKIMDNECLVISIQDEGIGIAPEYLSKLFNRFEQFDDNSRNVRGQGTGLGLALVKHLVTLHGGSVSCESELGKGSTFVVKLPIQ